MENRIYNVDVCVVGGGSAGYSAALAAAQNGLSVVLVEQQEILGGTSTQALVCSWASSPSGYLLAQGVTPTMAGYSLPQIIYQQMMDSAGASGVGITTWFGPKTKLPNGKTSVSSAIWALDASKTFQDSLLEYKTNKALRSQITFVPQVLHDAVVQVMNQQTTPPQVLLKTTLTAVSAKADTGVIETITAVGPQGSCTINAATFIDATGNISLCQMLEQLHPFGLIQSNQGINPLNYLSVCFQLIPGKGSYIPNPSNISVQIVEIPDGSYMINPLGELNGTAYTTNMTKNPATGYAQSYSQTSQRSTVLVNTVLQGVAGVNAQEPFFDGYILGRLAPFLGIRESYRFNGQYILTAADCTTPITKPDTEPAATTFIALADHNFDIVGENPPDNRQVCAIYGIPFDCLRPQPKTWNNLLVACRGAGLDHWAASSCRLERVMMQFGQAAGTAAALAKQGVCTVQQVAATAVAQALNMGQQLEYYYNLMSNSKGYGWPPKGEIPRQCPAQKQDKQSHLEQTAR